jgi:hypothetical protein
MAAKKKEDPEKTAEKPAKKAASPAKKAEAPTGNSKFATFLSSKKLDPRRVLVASRKLEQLRAEDRLLKLARRRAKSGGGAPAEGAKEGGEGGEKKAPEAPRKPRSGRPITPRALHAAMNGGPLSGPAKSRLLRAVNYLLEQKKAEKVDLKALF